MSSDHDTPTDAVSHRALNHARRVAMNSLENYRVVDEKHYWGILVAVILSLISNGVLWVYVLIQLPP